MIRLILLLGCILQLPFGHALELSVLGTYSCGEAEYDVGCSISSFMLPSFMMGLREGGVKQDFIQVGTEKVYIEWYNPVTDGKSKAGAAPNNFDLAVDIAMRDSNRSIGFVGFDVKCSAISNLARSMNMLLVSSQCDVEVGEASYPAPSVIQMKVTEIEKQRALVSLLLERGWDQVGIIHAEDNNQDQVFLRESLISILSDAGIKINSVVYSLFKDRNDMKYTQMVYDTIYKARILIVLSDLASAKSMLDKMYLMGVLTSGDYYLINLAPTTSNDVKSDSFWKNPPSTSPSLRSIPSEIFFMYFDSFSLFTNDASIPEDYSPKWTSFIDRLNQFIDAKECPLLCKYDIDSSYDWSAGSGFEYSSLDWRVISDAFTAGFIVAKQLPSLNPLYLTNGEAIANHLKNYSYTTLRDLESNFRDNGVAPDRYYLWRGIPSIYTTDQSVSMARTVPTYDEVSLYNYSSAFFGDAANFSILLDKWPDAAPPCGFENEKCPPIQPPFTDAEIAVIAASAGAAVILLAVIAYIWRWIRYERRLESDYWSIDRQEVTLMDLTRFGSSRAGSDFFGSMISAKSAFDDDDGPAKGTLEFYHQNIKREARLRKKKLAEKNIKRSSDRDEDDQWDAIEDNQLARFQGQLVILRRINKTSLRLTREMKRELDLLMTMKDDNINMFIGLINESHHIFTVNVFGPRKSLDDLLRNQDLRLDKMFKISFAEDVIKGMRYLHTKSKIGFHGNLKSSNCVVDAYWRVRLSGFGQHQLREGEPMEREQAFLWTAPEILRIIPTNMAELPKEMAQRADIYSVGTLLYEIYGRQGPYGDDLIDTSQIISALKTGSVDGVVSRPDLSLIQKAPIQIRDMVSRCWEEDPRRRPLINKIKDRVAKVNNGKRTNIADNIMELLDRYKYNLTDMIEERARDLDDERRRNESLLLQLLPRTVAEKLKNGNNVDAMLFDSVSIYFSDIVGFTSLSSKSTPLQIVNMLNDLYTRFDAVIDRFDCYKIETIGDAYMYVSGLPDLNGNSHVGEVAGAALELLALISAFEVKHLPDDKLRLRIGIHTGPVVTGVVGVKMPRYCLFGETVITASMMESSGEAMKIQLSVEAFKTLTLCGGFATELRGDVTLKSNEKMRSYWLLSYNADFRLSRLKADVAKYPHLARLTKGK